MAHATGQTLQERKAEELRRERRLLDALAGRKKELEKSKLERRQKKKCVGDLLCRVNLHGIEGAALRPAWTYVPRSYNLDRQIAGLVNHMYVRYPVPGFLYRCCRKGTGDPFECMHDMYRMWLVCLAQGGSFPKLVKCVMTSREAYVFLGAPAGNLIHENVWWAKMRVAGIPTGTAEKLIERVFAHYFFDDPNGRLAEAIQFFARYCGEMDKVTFGEITDFIAWKLRNDRGFSLKGRTLSSVIKLTNEWQVLMQKAKLGHSVEWKGLSIPDWEFEAKDRIWTVQELRNNRELMNEGRKQKHCVYSYVHWCVAGRSAIFSLRSYRKIVKDYTEVGMVVWDKSLEQTRITIEVNSSRVIVQVRGPLNSPPTDEERKALRLWAGEKGLILRG